MSAVPFTIPAQSISTAPVVAAASPSDATCGVPASDPMLPVKPGTVGTATAAMGSIVGGHPATPPGFWSMPEIEFGLRPFLLRPERLVHPASTLIGAASQKTY